MSFFPRSNLNGVPLRSEINFPALVSDKAHPVAYFLFFRAFAERSPESKFEVLIKPFPLFTQAKWLSSLLASYPSAISLCWVSFSGARNVTILTPSYKSIRNRHVGFITARALLHAQKWSAVYVFHGKVPEDLPRRFDVLKKCKNRFDC